MNWSAATSFARRYVSHCCATCGVSLTQPKCIGSHLEALIALGKVLDVSCLHAQCDKAMSDELVRRIGVVDHSIPCWLSMFNGDNMSLTLIAAVLRFATEDL